MRKDCLVLHSHRSWSYFNSIFKRSGGSLWDFWEARTGNCFSALLWLSGRMNFLALHCCREISVPRERRPHRRGACAQHPGRPQGARRGGRRSPGAGRGGAESAPAFRAGWWREPESGARTASAGLGREGAGPARPRRPGAGVVLPSKMAPFPGGPRGPGAAEAARPPPAPGPPEPPACPPETKLTTWLPPPGKLLASCGAAGVPQLQVSLAWPPSRRPRPTPREAGPGNFNVRRRNWQPGATHLQTGPRCTRRWSRTGTGCRKATGYPAPLHCSPEPLPYFEENTNNGAGAGGTTESRARPLGRAQTPAPARPDVVQRRLEKLFPPFYLHGSTPQCFAAFRVHSTTAHSALITSSVARDWLPPSSDPPPPARAVAASKKGSCSRNGRETFTAAPPAGVDQDKGAEQSEWNRGWEARAEAAAGGGRGGAGPAPARRARASRRAWPRRDGEGGPGEGAGPAAVAGGREPAPHVRSVGFLGSRASSSPPHPLTFVHQCHGFAVSAEFSG